ncbi:unnamed protein product [Phytophthora lilii]|uniref:Unnamed protein product n=1 Tax=Phytophthora lilii TaxID=2077276 RepID=A0A9W6WZD7_9STRA|nr:unnamed protein product [Phytophthora lilii]
MLTLTDDLEGVFSDMCDALNRQSIRDIYLAMYSKEGKSDEYDLRLSLEKAVMQPLLTLLDALQPDGSLISSAVPAEIRHAVGFCRNGALVQQMCRKVATVIKTKFAIQGCKEKYFVFPSQPNFADQEYGTVSFKRKTKNDSREWVFSKLMKLLEESKAPLTGRSLSHLKLEIRKDPELLSMFVQSSDQTRMLCVMTISARFIKQRQALHVMVNWLNG